MKPERIEQVKLVADWIVASLAIPGADAEHVALALETAHAGRRRFINGTNELRLLGVAATCTSGKGAELLRAWVRAARRAVDKVAPPIVDAR